MNDRYLKIEGGNFVKDTKTSAVLATNKSILLQNEQRKKIGKTITSNNDQINNLKEQVNNITKDMEEIKSMLKFLVQNKD